jgi:hypothetical protein
LVHEFLDIAITQWRDWALSLIVRLFLLGWSWSADWHWSVQGTATLTAPDMCPNGENSLVFDLWCSLCHPRKWRSKIGVDEYFRLIEFIAAHMVSESI